VYLRDAHAAFYFERIKTMAENETPTTETVELPAEPKGQGAATSETAVEDEYSRDRAMNTILNLRKKEKEWKKERGELEELKAKEQERKQADMTEAERYKTRAAELEAELKAERQGRMRLQVANEYNLPEALANRLQGDDLEALKADAEQLAKLLPKPQKENPKLSPNDIGDGKKGETDAQKRARIYQTGTNLFDVDQIKQGGGGVFFNTEK
jgi:hypothetical protein